MERRAIDHLSPNKFKKLCLRAQKLREMSWEVDKGNPDRGSYRLSQDNAARIACEDANVDVRWSTIIYYINQSYWNDIQSF